MTELQKLVNRLRKAKCPEDLFGDLDGDPTEALSELYRDLAKQVHPDNFPSKDQDLAQEGFQLLNELHQAAQKKIEKGVYGDRKAAVGPVAIRTRKMVYEVGDLIAQGDLANLYSCTFMRAGATVQGVIKIVRDPDNNDLVANEARILRILAKDTDHADLQSFIPSLVDSFVYTDDDKVARHANVFLLPELTNSSKDWYSLEQVMQAYPNGIDPKDAAWMWRRILSALALAHGNGIIHGALLPAHILILPEHHGVMLVDWAYAISNPATSGERISVISKDFEGWYPPEILGKGDPYPGTDVYMAARCMLAVLGDQPGTAPVARLRSFFKGCMLLAVIARPNNVWDLRDEFDTLIGTLWGARKFHVFSMPE